MTDEKRRPRPAAQYGPTGEAVALNVRTLRNRRNMTIYALSGVLARIGRPITPSAIAKIEKQQRQVTVDDLVALAAALDVSPLALLLPTVGSGQEGVRLAEDLEVTAAAAWEWADGQKPLTRSEGDPHGDLLRFRLDSRPAWDRDPIRKMYNEMLSGAAQREALVGQTGEWSKEADGTWVLRTPAGVEIWRGPTPDQSEED
ncbi:helix-turn-helix domain-containing protein [Streptomyces sp. NPDC020681]|uniref:helix-turn-helix domain-containing protein n=1 Tax=Streptomyces sp. NPDC020681 TaxID=3365083 RepID=UPI0037A1C700